MRIAAAFTILAGALLMAAGPALEKMRADAAAVRPLVKAECVLRFLDATAALPEIEPRVVYYRRDPKGAFGAAEAAAMPEEQRAGLRRLDFDAAKYYDTFYG